MDAPIITWKQDLLIIGFFKPLENEAAQAFQQGYDNKDYRIKIDHTVKLDNSLQLDIQLFNGDMLITKATVTARDEQINLTMQQHRINFQQFVGGIMGQALASMKYALDVMGNRKLLEKMVEEKEAKLKQEENATAVSNQVETSSKDGQESH